MAINLMVSKDLYKNDKLDAKKIHYMPCKIKYDGPANFSKFIQPRVAEGEKDVVTASFQGHPIHGTELKVPNSYVGLILEKSKNFDGPDKKVYATQSFDGFMHWDWDKVPNTNDAFIKAMDWIDIAEVLHSPADSS